MKTKFTLIFTLLLNNLNAQTVFHTEDITNFYTAFDSVQKTTDKNLHEQIAQKLYLDKGGFGMNYMIDNSVENRKATAKDWADMMVKNKESVLRIRPFFDNLTSQKRILEQKFIYFKKLYPNFKDGNVYFEMGLGMFGGRPIQNNLIIGCELMAKNTPDWAVSIVLHEFVHTLQVLTYDALLAHSLSEGAADFIAELVNEKSLTESYPNGYIDFGYKNEEAIWEEFKKYIASNEKGQFYDWLYGQKGITIQEVQMKDLGYFVGYRICKSYYDIAKDKKQAIKEIIELDVSTDEKAKAFLIASKYKFKSDLNFIKNLKFDKIKVEKKTITMIVRGYKLEIDSVVFQFELPKSFDKTTLKYITVAGTFNGWNPQDLSYKLTNTKNNSFELKIPKSQLKEKNHQFKFVINGDNWQNIPENASNTASGNLTLEIK